MKKATIAFLSAIMLSVIVTTISMVHLPAREMPEEHRNQVTLKLKWKHQFQFAGYYAAVAQGYYRDAGLDVRIEEALGKDESIGAVLDGSAQFGIAASDIVVSRARGKPVVSLAAIFQHSASGLLIKQGGGIQTIHDLIGKRVMLEPHSEEILAYLEGEGISSNQLITYPHSFDPTPLIQDQVDAMSAYSTDEPFLLKQEGIAYQFLSPRTGGIDFYGDTLFTSEDEIRRNPNMVQAFLEASLKGWEYAFANETSVIDLILSQYSTRHSREHLEFEAEQMRKLVLPDVVEAGYMNPARWKRIAETYVDLGVISSEPNLDGFLYTREPSRQVDWLQDISSGALAIIAILAMLIAAHGMRRVAALTLGRNKSKQR